MKRWFVFLLVGVPTLVTACSNAAPAATLLAPLPTRVTATRQPTRIVPTAVMPQPTTAPQASVPAPAQGETTRLRDEYAGFEIDYPADWFVTPIGDAAKKNSILYAVTIRSFETKVQSEGIPPGETKIDIGVNKNNAASPQAALEMRKQELANGDPEQKILSEEQWTLANNLQATRLRVASRFGESNELITALNGNTILLGGVGNSSTFDTIARTLRALE